MKHDTNDKPAQESRNKELIDYYVEDLERAAAELEITVDYYIAEFT